MNKVVREFIEEEVDKNTIQWFKKDMLIKHFRKLEHLIIKYPSYEILLFQILIYFKNRLFAQYRALFFNIINRRFRDLQRVRGEYIIFNSNLIWSVDNYNKLRDYDIEIYVEINVYARYILWCTIEIFNRSIINVLCDYFDTIAAFNLNQQSRFVRFNRDNEIVLII